MMLSTTFIGRLQKLYHNFSKQPPRRKQEMEKKKKKQRLSIQEKRNRQDSKDGQHLWNPLTLPLSMKAQILSFDYTTLCA